MYFAFSVNGEGHACTYPSASVAARRLPPGFVRLARLPGKDEMIDPDSLAIVPKPEKPEQSALRTDRQRMLEIESNLKKNGRLTSTEAMEATEILVRNWRRMI